MNWENILIVDDDPHLRKTLSDILRVKGYASAAVATGREALEAVRVDSPAVALIDLRLDDIPGLELIRQVKSLSPGTECVVLTGYATQASAIEAINVGAYSYVQKPFDIDQLLITIQRIVEKLQADAALRESQRTLSTLMSNLPGMAYRCRNDREWTMEFVSEGCYALTGYAPPELIANRRVSYGSLIHPEDQQYVWDEVQAALSRHGEFEITYRTRAADRSERWVWERGRGVYDAAGDLVAVEGFIADITDQRRAEEERARLRAQLEEQARRMQRLIDTVPDGVLLIDGMGAVLLANPAAQAHLEVLAQDAERLTHLGDLELVDLLATEGEVRREIEWADRLYRVIARPVEADTLPTDWVLVIRDVTEARKLEERLRQQDRLAVIGQLAGGVAHDFNNILTAIKGYTGLVLGELNADSAFREDLEEVERAADRAAALTSQLLIFSRKQVVQPRVIAPNMVIASMERMLRRLIGEDIELATELSSEAGFIRADAGQIEQVIMNLSHEPVGQRARRDPGKGRPLRRADRVEDVAGHIERGRCATRSRGPTRRICADRGPGQRDRDGSRDPVTPL